jgi:hypothetical protein
MGPYLPKYYVFTPGSKLYHSLCYNHTHSYEIVYKGAAATGIGFEADEEASKIWN